MNTYLTAGVQSSNNLPQSEEVLQKSKILVYLALMYELLTIYQPQYLKTEFLKLVIEIGEGKSTGFPCPCGSIAGTEISFMAHWRQKHLQAHVAFMDVKNGYYPFGQLDSDVAKTRSGWDEHLGSLSQQLVRIKRLVWLRQEVPKTLGQKTGVTNRKLNEVDPPNIK